MTVLIGLTPLTNNIILGFFSFLALFAILGIFAIESDRRSKKKDNS